VTDQERAARIFADYLSRKQLLELAKLKPKELGAALVEAMDSAGLPQEVPSK
jgi:hypothetical protein